MATEAAAPYIETLLKRVSERGQRLGVRFESGTQVRVTNPDGTARDVTNRPLSSREIMVALEPALTDDARHQIAQRSSARFEYTCAGVGTFNVLIRRDGEEVAASIDPIAAPVAARPPASVATPEMELIIETTSVSAKLSSAEDVPASAVPPTTPTANVVAENTSVTTAGTASAEQTAAPAPPKPRPTISAGAPA